jgi:hypothetical protein
MCGAPKPAAHKSTAPNGVSRRFQVSLYNVKPAKAVFACNLLAKDDIRLALPDEVVECWP